MSASSSSSSSSQRHSTRASHPPLTLAEEQAADALSQLEQRDFAAAMRLSLASSWESDDEKTESSAVAIEEYNDEEKEEYLQTPESMRIEEGWTDKIHAVEIPLSERPQSQLSLRQ